MSSDTGLIGLLDFDDPELREATGVLAALAEVFTPQTSSVPSGILLPTAETKYRTLIEQIPAVVFMAFLDRGLGEAYVSPQIETLLGFTQEECAYGLRRLSPIDRVVAKPDWERDQIPRSEPATYTRIRQSRRQGVGVFRQRQRHCYRCQAPRKDICDLPMIAYKLRLSRDR